MNSFLTQAKMNFSECFDARDIAQELKLIKANINQMRVCNGITTQEKADLIRLVTSEALNAKGRLRGVAA